MYEHEYKTENQDASTEQRAELLWTLFANIRCLCCSAVMILDLHHGAYWLAVRKDLTESLGAEDVTQRRLGEQLGRPGSILDVDDWYTWVGDAIVDDRVDCHRHWVARQDLIHTTQVNRTRRLHFNQVQFVIFEIISCLLSLDHNQYKKA